MIDENHPIRKDMIERMRFEEWFNENIPIILEKAKKVDWGNEKKQKTAKTFQYLLRWFAREIWIEIYAEAYLVGEAIAEKLVAENKTS